MYLDKDISHMPEFPLFFAGSLDDVIPQRNIQGECKEGQGLKKGWERTKILPASSSDKSISGKRINERLINEC